jgi:hypothetical protein
LVFLEVVIVKVRIVSLVSALLLLCVMIGGCSSSGGSTSLNDILKILPDNVTNVFTADWKTMSADTNLQELWTTYSQKLNITSMEEYMGVNSEDIDLMTMAAGTSVYYIVLKGKFDLENIRTVLAGQQFERQDDYLRVEVWNGSASIGFIHDMMIMTLSIDSLKTMIRLHEGEEKGSIYNNKDFSSIINKLPAGIFSLLSTSGGYDSTSTGISFGALSADSLSFSQYYMYADAGAAEAGKANIQNGVTDLFSGTVESVNQKNSLVEVKGSISISDFMNSTYFNDMGF